jgi:hypothetical protein
MSKNTEAGCSHFLAGALYVLICVAGILFLVVFSIIPKGRFQYISILCAIPIFVCAILIGIRTGEIGARSGPIPRSKSPKLFWTAIVFYIVATLVMTIIGILGALGHFAGHD